MATVVNNSGEPRGDSSSGWAVAVIILLVVVAGLVFWFVRYRSVPAPASPSTIEVNVPTPSDVVPGGGGSGGGNTGGATQ